MKRVIILAAVILAACGSPGKAPTFEARDAWARPADSAGTTAIYLVFVNRDTVPVTITGESSPAAASVSLHETMEMSGMVHMMSLDSVQTIAAGDSLVLAEGAKHLMLTGLTRKLSGGDSIPLDVHFRDRRVLHTTAVVRAP